MWYFKVSARPFSGGPVTWEIQVPNHELNEEKLNEINECFRNNLRWLKHNGGWPAPGKEDHEQMKKDMDKWSSTMFGTAIKVGDDMLKMEFIPFT